MSPSVGSMAGGTVLTIKGKGFDKRTKEVSVEVGGIKCHFDICYEFTVSQFLQHKATKSIDSSHRKSLSYYNMT